MSKLLWAFFLSQLVCLTLMGNNGGTDKIILEDFTKESKPSWTIRAGANIEHSLSFDDKIKFGDKEETVMSLEFKKKDALDKKGSRNWFEIKKPLTPQASWKNASALQIELSVKKSTQWWLQVVLISDGEAFTKVPTPLKYDGAIIQSRILKFKDFKNAKGKKIIPEKISLIFINGSATTNNVLYFNKLILLVPAK